MKILIVTKNWIGDVIFELPAIEAIRDRYPKAYLACLAPPRCTELLTEQPMINSVIEYDERDEHGSLAAKIRMVQQLREQKWDKVIFFHRSRTRAWMMWMAGIPQRIGYASNRSFLLTQAVEEPKRPMHQVDYFLYLVRKAGYRPKRKHYELFVSPKACAGAISFIRRRITNANYVCFHLGANWQPKRWPPEHFAALADQIAEKWGFWIVLTGTRGDYDLGQEMIAHVKKAHVVSLIAQTRLAELGALFREAHMVVSGDSGPMHIAAGVGAKLVALFGPTDPAFTGPRGISDPILLSHVPEGYTTPYYGDRFPVQGWLSEVTPEQVMEAVEEKGWFREPEKVMRYLP